MIHGADSFESMNDLGPVIFEDDSNGTNPARNNGGAAAVAISSAKTMQHDRQTSNPDAKSNKNNVASLSQVGSA